MFLPLTKIKSHSTYSECCVYKVFSPKGSLISTEIGNCHSDIGNAEYYPSTKNIVSFYLKDELLCYSYSDIKEWLKFLRRNNFPFHTVGEAVIDIDRNYCSYSGKALELQLKTEEYINTFHIFVAATLMRYVYYGWNEGRMQSIPAITFELKRYFGDRLDDIQALQLAFYCSEASDNSHAFIGSEDYIYIMDKETFWKTVKLQTKRRGINSLLRGGISISTRYAIQGAYGEGDLSKIGKLIKI